MAQAVGLSAAVDYLNKVGMNNVHQHEIALTKQTLDGLSQIQGVKIIGPVDIKDRGGVVSFTIDGVHPHDVGQYLDQHGIAVRTGHHCAWPLMRKLNLVGTTRASFHLYNTPDDVNKLLSAVSQVQSYFKVTVFNGVRLFVSRGYLGSLSKATP
jgi:cysteine desulfurase / selenocysteine lyase